MHLEELDDVGVPDLPEDVDFAAHSHMIRLAFDLVLLEDFDSHL